MTLVGYEVRRLRDQSEMQAALKLRHDVFCVEQGVPEQEELDGRDHDGIHLVAIHGGEVVATCRHPDDRLHRPVLEARRPLVDAPARDRHRAAGDGR